MAFNIREFKSAIERQGGLARLNLFEVTFTSLVNVDGESTANWITPAFDNRELRFFCQTVTFPGISVDVFNYRPNNIDVAQSIPFAIGHQQLECVFMIDDRHRVLNYFHEWMRRISNYSLNTNPNPIPVANEQLTYELGYKKEYAQTMTITMYSKSPSSTSGGVVSHNNGYKCILTDVYPVQVGSLTLSWNANDEYGTLPVSFSYSSMDVEPITNLNLSRPLGDG